jgi:hypothetical protein
MVLCGKGGRGVKPELAPRVKVDVSSVIVTIRNQRVILDRDLAAIYGVPTFRLNEAVKRNQERFPPDFVFQLELQEVTSLISQIAISKPGRGGVRKLPWAFTEHGALMAANILRSPHAVQMSVFVVRAFVRMRELLGTQRDLARKLAELEKKLSGRLDTHETAITEVLQQIMQLLNPSAEEPVPEHRRQIGFQYPENNHNGRREGREVRERRMKCST